MVSSTASCSTDFSLRVLFCLLMIQNCRFIKILLKIWWKNSNRMNPSMFWVLSSTLERSISNFVCERVQSSKSHQLRSYGDDEDSPATDTLLATAGLYKISKVQTQLRTECLFFVFLYLKDSKNSLISLLRNLPSLEPPKKTASKRNNSLCKRQDTFSHPDFKASLSLHLRTQGVSGSINFHRKSSAYILQEDYHHTLLTVS